MCTFIRADKLHLEGTNYHFLCQNNLEKLGFFQLKSFMEFLKSVMFLLFKLKKFYMEHIRAFFNFKNMVFVFRYYVFFVLDTTAGRISLIGHFCLERRQNFLLTQGN